MPRYLMLPGVLMANRAVLSVFTVELGSAGMLGPLHPHGQSTLEGANKHKTDGGQGCTQAEDSGETLWTRCFRPTEHSSSDVWTQPERSLRTQQAELRSTARFSLMSSCTCLSCRMQGEYLAPKWIRDSCQRGNKMSLWNCQTLEFFFLFFKF